MPYLPKEFTKEVRQTLRKKYPEFKFSIRTVHSMELSVNIQSGPLSLPEYEQVNQYYIDRDYNGKVRNFLKEINEVVSGKQRIVSVDGDYGNIPNYYVSISIGQWNKPYQQI